jgi:hypothetical protein
MAIARYFELCIPAAPAINTFADNILTIVNYLIGCFIVKGGLRKMLSIAHDVGQIANDKKIYVKSMIF